MRSKKLTIGAALLGAVSFTPVQADVLSWNFTQVSYTRPADGDAQGIAAMVSANFARNWVVEGEVEHAEDDSVSGGQIRQTRYDVGIGRVFPFTDRVSGIASVGLSHVEYTEKLAGDSNSIGFNAAYLKVGIRGRITDRLEADARVGILADDEDTSDLLYEAGVRYHFTHNFALSLGVVGSEGDASIDETLYRIGVRFDLDE